jgi:hypothetical protein
MVMSVSSVIANWVSFTQAIEPAGTAVPNSQKSPDVAPPCWCLPLCFCACLCACLCAFVLACVLPAMSCSKELSHQTEQLKPIAAGRFNY